jgi:hypothetical protein
MVNLNQSEDSLVAHPSSPLDFKARSLVVVVGRKTFVDIGIFVKLKMGFP